MLHRPGEGPFTAFNYINSRGGVEGYYAQVAAEFAAQATEQSAHGALTVAQRQRYQASGIDTERLFAEDIDGLAEAAGKTYAQFALDCLHVGAEWRRAESDKSRELARRLGFSEDVVEDPSRPTLAEESMLQVGISAY